MRALYNKKRTVTSRQFQTAMRLILPRSLALAKHAVYEGTKAVTKFTPAQVPGTYLQSNLVFNQHNHTWRQSPINCPL